MPVIRFILHDASERSVEVASGCSVMKAATENGVPGILADCGGAMACATCHVYVDPAWLPIVGGASAAEEDMLEGAVDPEPNSRLSCQISIEDRMDGLIVRVPRRQL